MSVGAGFDRKHQPYSVATLASNQTITLGSGQFIPININAPIYDLYGIHSMTLRGFQIALSGMYAVTVNVRVNENAYVSGNPTLAIVARINGNNYRTMLCTAIVDDAGVFHGGKLNETFHVGLNVRDQLTFGYLGQQIGLGTPLILSSGTDFTVSRIDDSF